MSGLVIELKSEGPKVSLTLRLLSYFTTDLRIGHSRLYLSTTKFGNSNVIKQIDIDYFVDKFYTVVVRPVLEDFWTL